MYLDDKLKPHMGHIYGSTLLKHINSCGILYNLILCQMSTDGVVKREQLQTKTRKRAPTKWKTSQVADLVFQNDPSKENLFPCGGLSHQILLKFYVPKWSFMKVCINISYYTRLQQGGASLNYEDLPIARCSVKCKRLGEGVIISEECSKVLNFLH